ncbi:MAG: sulfite exporter TauE/SafE family protein [Pseudomonadota bacterium]
MSLLVVLAGIATGILLGLFGSGGSIIAVPALLYLLDVGAKPAIAMSLGIVAVTASISAVDHWRRGNVKLPVAAVFGLWGVIGTYVGARLGVRVPASVQLALFALVMYLAAYKMLRPKPAPAGASAAGAPAGASGRIALHGLAVGLLTGLVGVGGGFLIVPALVLLSGIPMKEAVGTSLAVVAAKSYAGFIGYLGAVEIDFLLMALFTGVAIAGSFAGTWLCRHLPAEVLKRGFAVFLVFVASYILLKSVF